MSETSPAVERFFRDTIGVPRFWKMENLRAQDVEGTYQGQPGDWVIHLYLAYDRDTQIELIQPVAGRSIFQDFIDQRGEGVQHLAYVVAESEYEQAAAHLTHNGHALIQGFRIPLATVGYFDTYAAVGAATEVIGLTDAGHQLFEQIKRGEF